MKIFLFILKTTCTYSGGFGAFNGPPQNNNNSQYGRMNMNNSGYGMNQMQQNRPYGGGMKRPTNAMNDNMMSKRPRPDTGSWGSMGGNSNDGQNNMNKGNLPQQQNNNRGNWYQDQGYNSQQQSNYSWN